ncbi:MAG: hypothetical protein GX998_07565 [Firmicutes bacterium]|nr:hypothetical protein [Bacillota bacterium]
MEQNKRIGFLLITLGVLALAGQLGFLEGLGVLYILSLAFLGLYVFMGGRRRYANVGLLIPGLVILAVALSESSEDISGMGGTDDGIPFFIAAAFVAIYFIHTRVTGIDWATRHWPLIPASVLVIAGFINNPNFFGNFTYVIAIVLILAGLYLMRRPREN